MNDPVVELGPSRDITNDPFVKLGPMNDQVVKPSCYDPVAWSK